uniref:Uncharacterized protein n=1 Tax=Anguilla anguilla TaxID=7936 RepID=A0A0E9VQ35_ANGAN
MISLRCSLAVVLTKLVTDDLC